MFGVFNIAVLVDEMGFDEVTLHKVTKFVHTYHISKCLYQCCTCKSSYCISNTFTLYLQDAGLELKGKVVPSGFYLEF